MYLQGSHYHDNDINNQFYKEEYGKPDSTFLKPVTNRSKGLDKFVLKIIRDIILSTRKSVRGA